ncbi:hypothetical protein F511_28685 [Dorcoceras hygrometricum]|uniref:Retrotransposon gag domain-containing protein n=1 Tax=Dorcoceras hygrometricum TaxID=472368 RepID=A0A2Z7BJ54_9LAMI|nr:hypothetical protein F511_28685 [Dorcoceras hygrometricum]
MPPRRRGRATRQILAESECHNEEIQRSAPVRRRARQVDDEVDVLAAGVDEMELIMHIIGFFDRVRYDDERRLSLATFQLRKNAERWWRGASRMLDETSAEITWDSFCDTQTPWEPRNQGKMNEKEIEGLK